jgi:tetratricopeptide (TPR) repeat protein
MYLKKIIAAFVFCLTLNMIATGQTFKEASSHFYYKNYNRAIHAAQAVLQKDPVEMDAWYLLAESYLRQGKTAEAQAAVDSGMAIFNREGLSEKKYPLILIAKARLQMDKGDSLAAKTEMDRVLNLGKYKNADALLAAGRANIESPHGDGAWAVELLKMAVSRDKRNLGAYVALGDAYKKIVDGSNAVISYNEAIGMDAGYAEAMYRNGRIYQTQNNPGIYVDRFKRALAMDSAYAPAIKELYYHYLARDVVKAQELLDAYIRHSEPGIGLDYMQTDLYYLSRRYDEAIRGAQAIFQKEGTATEPRLSKLLAYSYAALEDSAAALRYMDVYFKTQPDTAVVAKDYLLKARLLEQLEDDKSGAIEWYRKAIAAEADNKEKVTYMLSLANLQKELGNDEREAIWREAIFTNKEKPSNVDLYNWGMALYNARNFTRADSIFALYEEKYPGQVYGSLMRARSNALIDTAMQLGLAVPHYQRLISIAVKDSIKNKSLLLKAFAYLGTYEANIKKDYEAALGYFTNMLVYEPANEDALKYTAILKKLVDKNGGE